MTNLNKYKNKIIAHRGIHDNITIPENSLKSFELAIKKDYPIELDIHITKDNQLVVFHDKNLKRMTKKDKNIEELSLTEIKNFNLLNTKEKIPTLNEVLNLIQGKVLIDIEIKNTKNFKKLINTLLENLNNYKGEIIIKSFNPRILKELKRKTNKYPIGLLISTNTKNKVFNLLSRTNIFINYTKPDFLAISKSMLNRKNIKKHLNKLPILIWTFNNKEELKKINNKNYIYITNIKPANTN